MPADARWPDLTGVSEHLLIAFAVQPLAPGLRDQRLEGRRVVLCPAQTLRFDRPVLIILLATLLSRTGYG